MSEQVRISWYRTPIDKDVLKSLTARSDLRGLLHAGGHLLLVVATGALAYRAWLNSNWLLMALLVWLHGTFYTFLGPAAAVHELSHGTPFRSRWLNDLFIRLVSFLTWSNFVHYRASHAGHHQYTVFKDLDLEVVLPFGLPRAWQWVLWLTVDPLDFMNTLRTTIRHARGRLEGEWEHRIFPESDPKKRRQLVTWARFLLIGHAVLAGVFIATGQWIFLLLVTFAHFIGRWLNAVVGLPQHIGMTPSVPDFRLCCRSNRLNPLFAFLYWNMNHHVEHHMYAGVPFYNLPKLRKVIGHDLPVIYPNLRATWRDILMICHRQKEDPSYSFMPPLPETAAPARTTGAFDKAQPAAV